MGAYTKRTTLYENRASTAWGIPQRARCPAWCQLSRVSSQGENRYRNAQAGVRSDRHDLRREPPDGGR